MRILPYEHKSHEGCDTSPMADDRDPSGVPAERGHVFLNPLEEGDLVHHAKVGHARNARWTHVGVEEALGCVLSDQIRLINHFDYKLKVFHAYLQQRFREI